MSYEAEKQWGVWKKGQSSGKKLRTDIIPTNPINNVETKSRALNTSGRQINYNRSKSAKIDNYYRNIICYYCSKPGHIAAKCRKKKRNTASGEFRTANGGQ